MATRTLTIYLLNKAQLWCFFDKAVVVNNIVRHYNGGVAIIELPASNMLYVRCMSDHVTITLDLDVTLGMTIKAAVTEAHCTIKYNDASGTLRTITPPKTDPWSTLIGYYMSPYTLT